jgi:hypothetical protein
MYHLSQMSSNLNEPVNHTNRNFKPSWKAEYSWVILFTICIFLLVDNIVFQWKNSSNENFSLECWNARIIWKSSEVIDQLYAKWRVY